MKAEIVKTEYYMVKNKLTEGKFSFSFSFS